MTINYRDTSHSLALELDGADVLNSFRSRFRIEDPETIYLDGNSLGRLPELTAVHLDKVIAEEWGARLIRSWNEGWYDRASRIGDKIAGIIGAEPGEVIVSDSTSVNLFKLACAALFHQPGRNRIVSDGFNFPSDLYILQGIVRMFGSGHHLELMQSRDGIGMEDDVIRNAINAETALVTLSHVAFKSAFLYDMEGVTRMAHEKGALVLWDLSHSAGALPVDLRKADADMAVGCTYKYLNGGPGAPAFLYIRKDLQDKLTSPVWGWFGDDRPFRFERDYVPARGLRKFIVGTPPVLSLSAIEPSVDMILEAGMDRIRKKSIAQTEYLLYLASEWLLPLGFSVGSPADPLKRGSHVSLRHPEGFRICKALIEPKKTSIKVIPDFREPDNIRLGITPLYTSFSEIRRSVERMREIVENKEFESYSGDWDPVT